MAKYTVRQLMQFRPSEFPTFVLGEARTDDESMEAFKYRIIAQANNSDLGLDSELECSHARVDLADVLTLKSLTLDELRAMPSDQFPLVLDLTDARPTLEGRAVHRQQVLTALAQFNGGAYLLCVVPKEGRQHG